MDEFYFEGPYLENRYFGYIANAEQDLGLYYEEGFLEEGYFDEAASSADLSCLSLRIKPLGSSLTLFSELLSSVNYTADFAAGLSSQFTPSVIGGVRKPLSAALAAFSDVQARGFLRYERPLQLEFSNAGFSTIRKFGSHSLQFTGSDRTEFYVDNSYSVNDLTIEFWVNCSSTNNQDIVKYEDTNGNLIWEVRLFNLWPAITTIDTGNVSRTATSSTAVTSGDWSFVKIERVTGTGPKIYVDGVLRVTGTSAVNKDPATAQGRLVFGDDNAVLSNFRVDEFRIIQGTTSNTVPTEEFVNDNLTKALFHFNNDYTDDIREIESGVATLSSSFVLAASISGPQRFPATTINAIASINAAVSVDRSADLEAFTDGSLTVTATRIQQGASEQSVDTTVTSAISKFTGFDSAQSVDTVLTADAVKSVEAAALIEGFASQLSAAVIIADGIVFEDVISSLSVTAEKITDVTSSADAETSLSTSAQTLLNGTASLDSLSELTNSPNKLTGYSAELNSAAEIETTAQALLQALAELTSTTNFEIDYSGTIIGAAALLASAGELTTLISKNQEALAVMDSQAELEASGLIVAQATIDIDALFAASIATDRIRNATITTDSISAQMTVVVANFVVDVPMDVLTLMSVDAVKITETLISVDSSSNMISVNSRTRDFVSDMSTDIVLSANGFLSGEARADLISTATMTTVAVKSGEILLQAFTDAGMISNISVLRNAVSVQSSEFTQSPIDILRIKLAQGILGAETNLLSSLTGNAFGSSVMTSQFNIVANIAVLQIGMFVYTIPNESRQYVIDEETREYEIFSETRLYNIRR